MSKINIKRKIHPLLLKMLTSKVTGELQIEGELPENGNYLIVANHYCIEDIPTLAQAVKKHFYILVSDEDRYTIDGLGLTLNGTEWVKRLDSDSRKRSAVRAVKKLKSGENFAMYPEATWNLSPNLLMLPMNYGCIRIALNANVPIVPVVSNFYSGYRHTIIGKPFYPTDNLSTSIELLRDQMAGMIYEMLVDDNKLRYNNNDESVIMLNIDGESYYCEKRDSIDNTCWEKDISYRYDKYKRARKDKCGVRKFESQFIFTPKNDEYRYFQIFNSNIINFNNKKYIKRISSEKNGFYESKITLSHTDDKFGYGYNEEIIEDFLKEI